MFRVIKANIVPVIRTTSAMRTANVFHLVLLLGLAAGATGCAGQGRNSGARNPGEPLPHPDLTSIRNGAPVASIADVVEKAVPSVVSIWSTRTVRIESDDSPFGNPLFRQFFGPAPE